MTGRNITKGMVAGFVATVVLSILMVMKSMMGLMPEFDIVAMLTGMIAAPSPIAGWLVHFANGAILWGGLFAWLDPHIIFGAALGGVYGLERPEPAPHLQFSRRT